MSFLSKFKSKATILKKDEAEDILGQKNPVLVSKLNNNQLSLLKLAKIQEQPPKNLNEKTLLVKRDKRQANSNDTKKSTIKTKDRKTEEKEKKIIQNPFLIQNQFFLDEEEHRAILKQRKDQQLRERFEKQRKKKQKLKEQMIKSMMTPPQKNIKYTKKQWVQLGGLGPNIGGEQWESKKKLQEKMLKFAEQIKKINAKKNLLLKNTNPTTNKLRSSSTEQYHSDPRSLGIKYSQSIPKPTFYSLSKPSHSLTREQSKTVLGNKLSYQISKQTFNQEDQVYDPEENQFSNLKIEQRVLGIQKLEDRYKEMQMLAYIKMNK